MMKMAVVRLLLHVAFLAATVNAAGVRIGNNWVEGGNRKLEAFIEMQVPCRMNSWTIIMDFSETVLEFQTWNAKNGESCVGKRQCEISNRNTDWLNQGSTLKFNALIKFQASHVPQINARWGAVCGRPKPTDGPVNPTSPTKKPPSGAKYDYGEVLGKSILFYEAQRSGKLPPNNRIPWRGDSAMGDGRDVGLDLTGGWYDAGDHVKFGFPMSATTTVIAWGMVRYKEAYEHAGEWENGKSCIKWPLDYFIKCHSSANELYGQLGNGHKDHAYWGRPEDMRMERPAYKIHTGAPGSDLAGETCAAMAAGSIVFKDDDPEYSATLLEHATQLYEFAKNHRGIYSKSISNAKDFYGSNEYKDELAWAGAWMHKATGDQHYLDDAKGFIDQLGVPQELSWNDKGIGASLLILEADPTHASSRRAAEGFVDFWLYKVKKTPKGLAWLRKWGPNRYSANAAFMLQVAAAVGIKPAECVAFAEKQINYILGDNGRSYVVGFGHNPPQRPHHRAASCPPRPQGCDWNTKNNPGPNPHVLTGALVGGPGEWDDYVDDRNDYVKNEVATDYNSGFQSAIAGELCRYVCGKKKPTQSPPKPSEKPTVKPVNPTSGPNTPSPTQKPKPPVKTKYNYGEVLGKSILFYEAQRSGKLPPNNRIPWRGDSALGDGRDVGLDLTGGWYDAGDHVKFGFPMSATTTVIAWGMIRYKKAYEYAGEWDNGKSCIKWPLDYFVKCHASSNELYGQLGNGHADHGYWGRPEDMRMHRPAYKIHTGAPGSDLAGETCAAMAAGSIVFKDDDPDYSATLLRHAEQLYEFAKNYKGIYSQSISNAKDFYGSNEYKDELAWAAAWMHKATGKENYLNDAKGFMDQLGVPQELSWNDKGIGAALLILESDPDHGSSRRSAEGFVDFWLYKVKKTPKGLAWLRKWGPNRYSANAAFMLQVAADVGIKTGECRAFSEKQINYMLGDNGRSYVVGFGHNPPQRPHHRAASCPPRPQECNWNSKNNPGPNPNVLTGALVGGPGEWDDYVDDRNDYVKNEVATDYNSGFQSAIAGELYKHVKDL